MLPWRNPPLTVPHDARESGIVRVACLEEVPLAFAEVTTIAVLLNRDRVTKIFCSANKCAPVEDQSSWQADLQIVLKRATIRLQLKALHKGEFFQLFAFFA